MYLAAICGGILQYSIRLSLHLMKICRYCRINTKFIFGGSLSYFSIWIFSLCVNYNSWKIGGQRNPWRKLAASASIISFRAIVTMILYITYSFNTLAVDPYWKLQFLRIWFTSVNVFLLDSPHSINTWGWGAQRDIRFKTQSLSNIKRFASYYVQSESRKFLVTFSL